MVFTIKWQIFEIRQQSSPFNVSTNKVSTAYLYCQKWRKEDQDLRASTDHTAAPRQPGVLDTLPRKGENSKKSETKSLCEYLGVQM